MSPVDKTPPDNEHAETDVDGAPGADDLEPDEPDDADGYDDRLLPEPPHPINWNLLTADEAETEWWN